MKIQLGFHEALEVVDDLLVDGDACGLDEGGVSWEAVRLQYVWRSICGGEHVDAGDLEADGLCHFDGQLVVEGVVEGLGEASGAHIVPEVFGVGPLLPADDLAVDDHAPDVVALVWDELLEIEDTLGVGSGVPD